MSRADEMQDLITRWEASDLTQRAFTEREGVAYSAFQYWRRRLRQAPQAPQATKRRERAAPVQLSPVRIIPDPRPARATAAFELRTPHGLTLSVPAGFDEDALRRLLDVLAAC